jgi:hypothetical protein
MWVEAIAEVARTAVAALLALAALSRGPVRPAELGQLAWLAVFEDDDRAEFFDELRDALSVAESTRDATPVGTCLREWRTTARALSDPLAREILAGPGDDDYAEAPGRRNNPAPAAYRPPVAARRPGGRPSAKPVFRVLVHHKYLAIWNELADRVGLANAQISVSAEQRSGSAPTQHVLHNEDVLEDVLSRDTGWCHERRSFVRTCSAKFGPLW